MSTTMNDFIKRVNQRPVASQFIFIQNNIYSMPMFIPPRSQVDNHLLIIRAKDWKGANISFEISPINTYDNLTSSYDPELEYNWLINAFNDMGMASQDNNNYIAQENNGLIMVSGNQNVFSQNININFSSLRSAWIRCCINKLVGGDNPVGLIITLN
jgi:hypothetical protein